LVVANAQVLLFEVEIPEKAHVAEGSGEEFAARRINWYRRQGARVLGGVRYFQSVDRPLPPVEMHIMAHPLEPMSAAAIFDLALELFGEAITPVGVPTLD
jgi:hypothetical protein